MVSSRAEMIRIWDNFGEADFSSNNSLPGRELDLSVSSLEGLIKTSRDGFIVRM